MKRTLRLLAYLVFSAFVCGCASPPSPLSYLSLKKPTGVILTKASAFGKIKEEFPRGGWYFFNDGFRPAADIQSYLKQVEAKVGTNVLRDADVGLAVPFAFDILLFGYNHSTDIVTVGK